MLEMSAVTTARTARVAAPLLLSLSLMTGLVLADTVIIEGSDTSEASESRASATARQGIQGVDNDGDGFDATVDCNDNAPDINPVATDIPGDDIDQNCTDTLVCYDDGDMDGYGTTTSGESSFTATGGAADLPGACGSATADLWDDDSSDCHDQDPAMNPGADEVCDGQDNDCDGAIDEADNELPEGACAVVFSDRFEFLPF
ncbi:MAG: hypothetical protein HND55_08190 [Pseudomonadota bacterium]|nr:MAG: hypothetical protein HND55_08190 [Pseudomonadota bacterium]